MATSRAKKRVGWVIAAAAVAVGVPWFITVRADRVRRYEEARAAAEYERRRALAAILRRSVTAERLEVLDEQCRGKGSFPFGWKYAGLTYAREDVCRPFSDPNITNFFCCADAAPRSPPAAP